MNKYKKLLKDTFIFAIGNIGSKFILFLLVPLYTNYMTAEEYGTSDLVFTVAQLLLPVVSLVIYDAVIRFGLSKFEKRVNVLLCAYIVLVGSGIFTASITILIGLYDPIEEWKWYLAIYVILSLDSSIQMNYLKVKDKNVLYSIISIMQTLLMAGLNILFLVVLKTGVKGYLISYIVAISITVILSFVFGGFGADLKTATFDRNLLKKMIVYSSPLVLNNISWWVVQSSDKMMVEWFIGTSALGIYSIASKIPSLINVMTNVFSQAWGISSVKEIESTNDGKFYSNVLKMYIFVSFGLCILFVSIIKPFMNIYVGELFYDAWRYVPMLLCAAVFASIAYYYGSLYGALRKTVNNMLTTVAAAIVNIIANYILLSRIGLYGAILGTLLSYIVMAHARMIDISRYILIEFSKVKYLVNCFLMLLQACLVTMDFHIFITSLITIMCYLLINVSEIKQIIKLKKQYYIN